MTLLVFHLLGGIGLFLMGMILLTDGLKAFAGDSLRKALVRFTGKPYKAFLSGALVTTLVQSSSATTVAVIGFVSAGLLTFSQAVGVVLGASLGTTATGWMVSVLGLKVSIGFYALPVIGLGAFMRLLARGRWAALGMALAGFGIIFIGIDALQTGMADLENWVDLGALPSEGLVAQVVMTIAGIFMTVVMQSSSAAMATTLTALHTGSIQFEQAASLVIGAAIGTTITGALAAIGASVSAKRTALAHVTFNLATGVIALILLPVFLWGIDWLQEHAGLNPGAVSLAAFHTAFISLGVILFLPFVRPFAKLIERILPDTGPSLTRHLDDSLLLVPAVALETTKRALSETACELFNTLRDRIGSAQASGGELRSAELRNGLAAIKIFFEKVPPISDEQPISEERVAQIHAIDHLDRLQSHLQPPEALRAVMAGERLKTEIRMTQDILALAETGLDGHGDEGWLEEVKRRSLALAERRRKERPQVIQRSAEGGWPPGEALTVLDALRWLDRVSYHVWRIANYLAGSLESEDDARAKGYAPLPDPEEP